MAVRRWALGGVAALLLMLATMVQPASASAEAPPQCPTGMLCAWTGSGFTGTRVVIDPSTLDDCWHAEDGVTYRSVWNATASGVYAWESQLCWGRYQFINPGTGGDTWYPVRSFL